MTEIKPAFGPMIIFLRYRQISGSIIPPFHQGLYSSDSTQSIFLLRNNREHADNHGQSPRRSGKVWRNRLSPTRVGYRKSDRLLFLNMFKSSSRSKPVGRWSSWSFEGLLKVALSRLPSSAFVYSLELSSKLGSFRIPSAALCRGSCEGCHK